MFRIIENTAAIQGPVPAARGFKAEQAKRRKLFPARSLYTDIRNPCTATSKETFHLFERCIPVVSEFLHPVLDRKPRDHGKHSLPALQIRRFMDIVECSFFVHSLYCSFQLTADRKTAVSAGAVIRLLSFLDMVILLFDLFCTFFAETDDFRKHFLYNIQYRVLSFNGKCYQTDRKNKSAQGGQK